MDNIKKTEHLYSQAKSRTVTKEQEFALDSFKDLGLPTKKVESYKYCNLSKFVPETMTQKDLEAISLEGLPSDHILVFVNGHFDEKNSKLPEGLTVEKSKAPMTLKEYGDAMEALCDSVAIPTIIKVPAKADLPLVTVIQRYNTDSEALFNSKLHIEVGTQSRSSFVEVFELTGEYKSMVNAVTSMNLDKAAHVLHQKVVLGDLKDYFVTKVRAEVARDANFNSQTLSTGAFMARNNVEVNINDEGAHTTVNGLFTTRGEQLHDNFSHIAHNVGHTTSEQVFKGILDDSSKGAFTGRIVIHRDAQLCDSSQLNKNLLLDSKAHVDTRPQLEVYADDVKCAHGATVGQMSEDEVFYLESRGIEKSNAQKILCHAFAREIFDSSNNEILASWLDKKLYHHFEQYALDKMQ